MSNRYDVRIGSIVKSLMGRDKDRFFIVLSKVDENFVLISDGDLRKSAKPKKKKLKHLKVRDFADIEVETKLGNDSLGLDAEIRKLLQRYKEETK